MVLILPHSGIVRLAKRHAKAHDYKELKDGKANV